MCGGAGPPLRPVMGVRLMRERSGDRLLHQPRRTAWAEWLAWQLQQAGWTVELDVWDWAPGEDFVARMQAALQSADRLLAVCTEAYFASAFGGAELRAAFAGSAAVARIVPVLIEPVILPALYAPLIVTVQLVAGIQTLPLVSSVRTSKGRRPCLAAVDR